MTYQLPISGDAPNQTASRDEHEQAVNDAIEARALLSAGSSLIALGSTSGADAITAAIPSAFTGVSISTGTAVLLNPVASNTGPVTLDVGNGAAPVHDGDGAALEAGALRTNHPVLLRYSSAAGGRWRMVSNGLTRAEFDALFQAVWDAIIAGLPEEEFEARLAQIAEQAGIASSAAAVSTTARDQAVLAADASFARSPVYETVQDGLDAAAANLCSKGYTDRATAEGANVPESVDAIYYPEGGRVYHFIADPSGTALTTGDGRTWSPADVEWTPYHFGAFPGADTASEARDVAIAMQDGYEAAAEAGKPYYIGPGTWFIHMNPEEIVTGATGNRISPLRFDFDNAVVFGAGQDKTVIRAFVPDSYACISWRKRGTLENGIPKIFGGLYADFTVDGGLDDPMLGENIVAAAGASGLSAVSFERIKFCNASQYCFGAQNGGHRLVRMVDCVFENSGYDGIDIKNNNPTDEPSVNYAFHLIRPVFSKCCQREFGSPGAWCDVMGDGCIVDNPVFINLVTTGNANALLRIKQGQDATNTRGLGGYRSVVSNFQCEYTSGAAIEHLIHVRAPFCSVDNPKQSGDALDAYITAVLVRQPYCSIKNPHFYGSGVGVEFSGVTGIAGNWGFLGGAFSCSVLGGSLRGFDNGFLSDRDSSQVRGVAFLNCNVGLTVSAGNAMVTENDFSDSTTAYNAPSSSNIIFNNIGTVSPRARQQDGIVFFDAPSGFRVGTYAGTNFVERFRVATATDDASRLQILTSESVVALVVEGDSADMDMRFNAKGNGKLRFGERTATSDVPITGYIEIKDAGGAIRRLAVID